MRVCPHLHWPGLLPSGGLRTHHPQSSMCRGTPLPSSAVRLSDHSSSHHLDRRTCGQPWEAARTAGGGGGGRGRRAFRKPGRVLLCSVTLTSSVTCTRVGTLFLYKVREYNVGDPGSIPGSGRSLGEGIDYPPQCAWASLVVQMIKNPTCNARDLGSIPGLGCLENPRDGGAWWATVYGVAQSRTRLKQLCSSSMESKKWH